MAQDFDTEKLELRGEASPLPVRVGATYQTGYFSAVRNLLVYRSPASARLSRFSWVDTATGKNLGTVGDPGLIGNLQISPDGARVAYRRDSDNHNESDIWILDLARGSSTRLTFGQGTFEYPVWSPDGTEIAFAGLKDKRFQVFRQRVDGSGEAQVMSQTNENARPLDWSPDGRFLIYDTSPNTTFAIEDIWILPLEKGAQPIAFANSRFDESAPRFSPDGRWIAYESNETGRYEIYVRGFAAPPAAAESGKWMISKDGGRVPQWNSNGKEIAWVHFGTQPTAVSVDVDTVRGFHAGLPRGGAQLPAGIEAGSTYSADLKKRLVAVMEDQGEAQKEPQYFDVLVNWTSALKK
jgi:Tol biopolymer transport system component